MARGLYPGELRKKIDGEKILEDLSVCFYEYEEILYELEDVDTSKSQGNQTQQTFLKRAKLDILKIRLDVISKKVDLLLRQLKFVLPELKAVTISSREEFDERPAPATTEEIKEELKKRGINAESYFNRAK